MSKINIIKALAEGAMSEKELKKTFGAGKKLDRIISGLEKSIVERKHGMISLLPSVKAAVLVKITPRFGFASSADDEEDIYIPARGMSTALVGDEVLLKTSSRGYKSREGRVICILKRTEGFIAELELRRDGAYLLPIRSEGVEIRLSGPAGARQGDRVFAVVERESDSFGELRARITAVLGDAGNARGVADGLLLEAGIPVAFSPAAEADAKRAAKLPDTAKRTDERIRTVLSIDSESAKDLDDAIFAERTAEGYLLQVHIADVSHYVPFHSALDAEAMERGTSIYYADRVVPMLPAEISNGVCSLHPGEDKLTLAAYIGLDAEGEIRNFEFKKSLIRSRVKGVYSQVNDLFAGNDTYKEKYADTLDTLTVAREIYQKRLSRRRRLGAMEIEGSDCEFTVDENGSAIDVRPAERGEAERVIEELMLLANECAALFAKERKLPFVYRVHDLPPAERLEALRIMVNRLEPDFTFKQALPDRLELSELLDKTRGTPHEKAVHYGITRSMAKAVYSEKPKPHYGLALENYAHFTSPIRRYPDLTVHRIISAALEGASKGEIYKKYGDFTHEAAAKSTSSEQRAVTVQRECEKCYKAEFLADRQGESFDGYISSVTERGVYVEILDCIEGYCSFAHSETRLKDDITLEIEYPHKILCVGDTVRVKLVSVNVSRGHVDFELE